VLSSLCTVRGPLRHLGLELVREFPTLPSSHLDLLRGVAPTSWWSVLPGQAQTT